MTYNNTRLQMKFCPDCENALTDIRDDGAGVGFECRKCKYNEKITRANPLVYEHNLNRTRRLGWS